MIFPHLTMGFGACKYGFPGKLFNCNEIVYFFYPIWKKTGQCVTIIPKERGMSSETQEEQQRHIAGVYRCGIAVDPGGLADADHLGTI